MCRAESDGVGFGQNGNEKTMLLEICRYLLVFRERVERKAAKPRLEVAQRRPVFGQLWYGTCVYLFHLTRPLSTIIRALVDLSAKSQDVL